MRVVLAISAAVATAACSELTGGQATCPQVDAPRVTLGGSAHTRYRGNDPVACILVAAGDTVDLALFFDSPNGLTNLRLEADDAKFLAIPQPAEILQLGGGRIAMIYGGLVPAGTGVVRLYFRASDPCISCHAPIEAAFTIRLRKSAPVIVQRLSVFGTSKHLMLRANTGSPARDTLWVRNVGAGTAALGLSTTSGIAGLAQGTVAVAGPSRGWSANQGAVPIAINVASLDPGIYADNLEITGIPDDDWNFDFARSIPINVRFDATDVRTMPIPNFIYQIAVSPTGEMVAGTFGNTLYSVDAQTGDMTAWGPSIPGGICCNFDSFQFGPDTALYYRGVAGATRSVFRVKPPATPAQLTTGPIESFAVLPDRSVLLTSQSYLIERLSPDGTRSFFSYWNGSSTLPASLHFSVGDSALYYMETGGIGRFNLRTGSSSVFSAPQGRLVGVDRFNRLYVSVDFVFDGDARFGNYLVVFDSNGRLAQRRYPPGRFMGLAIARDSLFLVGNNRIWVMPVAP